MSSFDQIAHLRLEDLPGLTGTITRFQAIQVALCSDRKRRVDLPDRVRDIAEMQMYATRILIPPPQMGSTVDLEKARAVAVGSVCVVATHWRLGLTEVAAMSYTASEHPSLAARTGAEKLCIGCSVLQEVLLREGSEWNREQTVRQVSWALGLVFLALQVDESVVSTLLDLLLGDEYKMIDEEMLS